MKKQYVFTEEEIKEIPIKMAEKFLEQQKRGYGFKLVSNETGETVEEMNTIIGHFYITFNNLFN